jgi:hypothetical protein
MRSRVLMSARTATRTFDLQLAIATLRLPAPALCRDWNGIRTLPVVHGGNRPALFAALGETPECGNRFANTVPTRAFFEDLQIELST